jgi:hypothetical protein
MFLELHRLYLGYMNNTGAEALKAVPKRPELSIDDAMAKSRLKTSFRDFFGMQKFHRNCVILIS